MKSEKTFPRPDFARSRWQSLDGLWQFAFSDEVSTDDADLVAGRGYNRTIQVPFCYQCTQSGIGDKLYHECVWYSRTLTLTADECAGSVLLNFGAVDYECYLYLNGQYVGAHTGGFAQFGFDIAPNVHPGENIIVLSVRDDRSVDRPRGKQSWLKQPDRCWYTPTTGIWRSVWVEFTAKQHISELRLLPDIDRRCVMADLRFSAPVSGQIVVQICWQGHLCKELTLRVENATYLHECITLAPEDAVDDLHLWSPQSPSLYSVSLTLTSGSSILDEVGSYFGMRKIEVNGNEIRLNYQPLYQRLILDQSYWRQSLMTPPDEDALIHDLTLIRDMGFNGLRMHQKNEDPLLLYHADRLGLLVWLEMPSSYACTPLSVRNVLSEWDEIIRQNWNHPSIIVYVPFNESWGIRDIRTNAMQRSLANCAYHLTRALDPTRLVSTNDGWEFPENTDFYGFHSYFPDAETFRVQFSNWSRRATEGMVNRPLALSEKPLPCRPVLLTEFGGIAIQSDKDNIATQFDGSGDWGYNTAASDPDELAKRLQAQLDAVLDMDYLCGYCYTQLTDVEQEINGLLTPERVPKLPIPVLHEIFSRDPICYRR